MLGKNRRRIKIVIDKKEIESIHLNAKGFGGNNGSCAVISPNFVKNMIDKSTLKTHT